MGWRISIKVENEKGDCEYTGHRETDLNPKEWTGIDGPINEIMIDIIQEIEEDTN